MITFKVRNISGGIGRSSFVAEARDLRALAADLEAQVVGYFCNWALLHGAGASSWEVTWTNADRSNRQPANT